MVPNLMNTRND